MTYGYWGWPQIVFAGLWFMRLVMHAVHHGKPIEQKYNFPLSLLLVALIAWMAWMGGWWEQP